MSQLTREQFIAIFKIDPDTKQPVSGSNAIAPRQEGEYVPSAERIARGSTSIMDMLDAVFDVGVGAIPNAISALGRGENVAEKVAEPATQEWTPSRVRQNLAASGPAVVASVPAMADLVSKGVPAVVAGALSDEDKSFTTRVADEFMSRILTPEATDALADQQAQVLEQFVRMNPDAKQSDIAAFHKQYLESDEFYNSLVDQLPAGLRTATRMQQTANDIGNLGVRPDKMTAGDDALQIIGGSFLGLPASTVSKIARPAAKLVGERIAKSIPGRIAARTVEAVTPLTLPLTPGNIALNAGAGVGISEAIRGLSGQDTLIDYENLYDPNKNPEPEQLGAALGVSAGILFGLPSVTKQLAEEAAQQTEKAAKFVGQTAGPTLEEQSTKLKPQISETRGLIDSNAPVKAAAQKFGAQMDDVQLLDAAMSSASTANRVETVNNALNYGILEGIDNTVPFVEVERAFMQLDDVTKDALDKYVYAVQRASNERIYEKSLMEQISQAQNKLVIAQASGNKGRLNAATKEFTDLQMRYQQLQKDDPSTRSLMRDWTREEVQQYIRAGDANPQIKQIADAMKRVSGDLLTYMQKNGMIDADTARNWRSNRSLHVKVQERPYADKGPLARRALLFRDKFKPVDADTDQPFFVNTASRNVSGEGAVVNNPLPAIAAIKETIIDTVRNVAANNARKEVVDTLAALPNAKGRLLRPYEFNTGNGKTTSISPSQYDKLYPKGIKNEENYVKVLRNGKIELWEFSNENITRSLQFSPIASVPIFNATRKIYQQTTTGVFAPWFAARAFLWDVPIAQTTKNAGRSLGLIDTFARRLFMGTNLEGVVGGTLDRVFDPTAFMSAAVAIPAQLGLRAAKAVGDKIASDLAQSSGIFNAIAKSGPVGQEFVRRVGTVMATTFDQSALAVMSRNMSTSMSHLNDVSKMRMDYAKAGSNVTGPVRAMFDGYKAMLDSVHMATRYAFFANNYGMLKAKYGANIPKNEIKKLVQETRNLTGDMSRQSNNKTVQKITSVIPYSNAMLQGTRHILTSAVPSMAADGINVVGGNIIRDKDTRFWWQFVTGVGIPTLGALNFLSHWEGSEDYWYNQTPKWKQMTGIPIPSPEVLMEYAETGQLPKFSPEKLNVVPIAPELSMILAPVVSAARMMGMIGNAPYTTPQPFGTKVKDVMDQITSFATPPLISAAAATSGMRVDIHGLLTGQGGFTEIQNQGSGANADMITSASRIPQAVYDTLGALFSSSAQLAMQSMNAFDISMQERGDFAEAASEAFDTAKFEVERRMPEVTTGMWDVQQRHYAFTPESEYVYKTERALEPIIGTDRQLSVERDTKNRVGLSQELDLIAPKKLRDQNLRGISMAIWDVMKKKGPYKEATEQYSQVRKLLKDLENSRSRMPDNRYNRMRNELVKKQQALTRTKSQVLQSLEQQLNGQIGKQFQQQYGVPFSFDNLADLVRKDVAGP